MNIYDFIVKDSHDKDVCLAEYRNKVLLIVNTATHCGFTPQYQQLQALYEKYQQAGFEVLDFPCNQFANQAPENNDEIVQFCQLNYGTTFRTFAKVDVNGKDASPLFTYLKSHTNGLITNDIKWNFTKFLVNKQGDVIRRYAPTTAPNKLEQIIAQLLNGEL